MKALYWKLQSKNQELTEEKLELFKNHYKKDYKTGELYSDVEATHMWHQSASNNPLFAELFSLTVAYENEGKLRVKYLTGNEKDIIQSFLNILNNKHFKDYEVVHFDAGIILPYFGIRKTACGNKEHLPKSLSYKGLRPWNLSGVCLKDYFKGAGDYTYSLLELGELFGLKANIISYVDEGFYYFEGKKEELLESAIQEITLLANVHRLENGLEKIEAVVSKEEVKEVEVKGEENLLLILAAGGDFSTHIKRYIIDKIDKKRLTKKDKENLEIILKGLYFCTDFINMNQDSKKVIQEKTLEIEEFIKTL